MAGFPGSLSGLFGVGGDFVDGGGQLLHRAGLLGGPLRQGLGAVGHLVGACGHLLGAHLDLAHCVVQLRLNAVQGLLDGSEIAHIFLLDAVSQVAAGYGVQHAGDFADVGPQALDSFPENLGQIAHLVVGVDADADFLAAGQAQITLLQPAGHLSDLSQRGGDGPFEIGCHDHNAHDNNADAHQGGHEYGHIGLLAGFCVGDAGENQAVDLAVGVPCGDIGAQIFLVQNLGLAHIGLPLLEDGGGQAGGQLGAYSPLSVLDYGGVGPGVALKDGKFTAHAAFQAVKQLVHIGILVGLAEEVGQHVGAVGAAFFQDFRCQAAEHDHAHGHRENHGNNLHDNNHVADLLANALVLSAVGALNLFHTHYSIR